MNSGEIYASKKSDWAEAAATVVVTIEDVSSRPLWRDHEMIECLVVVDDASLSARGPGTTDCWHVRQLLVHFDRIM